MAAEAIGWACAVIVGAWGVARSARMTGERDACVASLRALEARIAETELAVADLAAARIADGEDRAASEPCPAPDAGSPQAAER